MMQLILASASPRRRQLLSQLNLEFTVLASSQEEKLDGERDPVLLAERLALAKAREVAAGLQEGLVIGADTIVVLGDRILGKPAFEAEAKEMLELLSGRKHQVISGLALVEAATGKHWLAHEVTGVWFRILEPEAIEFYIATGEPFDKAGAYGIQGLGAVFVEKIEGCYFNVVGLPLARLYLLLREAGFRFFAGGEEKLDYRWTIKDLPAEMRPREKMQTQGPEALSNGELLAILIRVGNRSESALDLANRLLAQAGGLRFFVETSIEELSKIKGIGLAKASQIKAAVELGRRIALDPGEMRPVIRSPEDVASLLMEKMRFLDREHFQVMTLNTKNQVLGIKTAFIGSLNSSIVHPREIFKEAIKRSAAALILVHNHPSGDPSPSPEDLDVTRRLQEAGRLLGIEILDHVIIGDRKFYSLKQQGKM